MNHPFVKMLRFELKSNYITWLFNMVIGIGILTTMYFQGDMHNSIRDIFMFIYPMFLILTWIFTINSYQESIKNQPMQMYHLIPVPRNTKFFSKQFITLIAYPFVLIAATAIFIGIIRIFINAPYAFQELNIASHASITNEPSSMVLLVIWICGHSISTFFAIIFKNRKNLYALLFVIGFQFILGIAGAIFISNLNFKNATDLPALINQNVEVWLVSILLIISIIFYTISYRLFFRRQL